MVRPTNYFYSSDNNYTGKHHPYGPDNSFGLLTPPQHTQQVQDSQSSSFNAYNSHMTGINNSRQHGYKPENEAHLQGHPMPLMGHNINTILNSQNNTTNSSSANGNSARQPTTAGAGPTSTESTGGQQNGTQQCQNPAEGNNHIGVYSNGNNPMHVALGHPSYTQSPSSTMDTHSTSTSNLRWEIVLEAPTAGAQRIDESPLTYLNKGQFYGIVLNDTLKVDGDFVTTMRMMFHDDAHRKLSPTYWNFWLSQQTSPKTARAMDLDKAASSGIKEIEMKTFDRIIFRWNGKKGAKIYVRFNCLSTDFSRIKGVKGIPLKVSMETRSAISEPKEDGRLSPIPSAPERSCCKVKLFRDKGAERKNKDDQRHLEKVWEKMRGKIQDANPLLMMFAPVNPTTVFLEAYPLDPAEEDDMSHLPETIPSPDDSVVDPDLHPFMPSRSKRKLIDGPMGPEYTDLVGLDPTYVPLARNRKRLLCLYVRSTRENVYRAIYLERLSVQDLIAKLSAKLEIKATSSVNIHRQTKKGLSVRMDDSVVAQLEDEQDIVVDYTVEEEQDLVNFTLQY